MLEHATDQIIGDADIECSTGTAGENVNPEAHAFVMDCRVKPRNRFSDCSPGNDASGERPGAEDVDPKGSCLSDGLPGQAHGCPVGFCWTRRMAWILLHFERLAAFETRKETTPCWIRIAYSTAY